MVGLLLRVVAIIGGLGMGACAMLAPAMAVERLNFSWVSNVGPLNPHGYSPNQMFAQAMVYEPLVRYRADGTIAPWLALSWEIFDDGRSAQFHLRKDVTFSNGEPFNAAAVAANFEAILKDRESHSWLELANQIASVEVTGPYSVLLRLKEPYYPLLQELALPRPFRFVAPSQFINGGTMEGIVAPIGTGPWVLSQTRPGEHDLFIRNERYWGQKPAYDEIDVKVISDPNSRAIAFEIGDIDLIYGVDGPISPDNFQRFAAMPKISSALSGPMETRLIALNSKSGPTRDLAVRKAINHGVDKDAIIATILYNTETRADALYAPNVPYANIGLAPYLYDPAKSIALLEEAGWVLEPGSGLRSRNGEALKLDLVFTGTDAISKSIAEIIQAQLATIGIGVFLIGEEESSVTARQHDGRFGMIFSQTFGAAYDPHAHLSSMRTPSHADYQAQLGLHDKAQLDARIGQALLSRDEATRQALYANILNRLHEEAIYLPLTYVAIMALGRPGVKNISFSALSSEIPFERFAPALD
ncbi:nickel ABC transporter substrate-binding protein [Aquamicrobium segne]|uniref:Nickel ABC transporter substrate-binding protein n=1 Tax=Aquamicrobium segne TaxID=469547 RepID=A0ABW0GTH2_9HYPH